MLKRCIFFLNLWAKLHEYYCLYYFNFHLLFVVHVKNSKHIFGPSLSDESQSRFQTRFLHMQFNFYGKGLLLDISIILSFINSNWLFCQRWTLDSNISMGRCVIIWVMDSISSCNNRLMWVYVILNFVWLGRISTIKHVSESQSCVVQYAESHLVCFPNYKLHVHTNVAYLKVVWHKTVQFSPNKAKHHTFDNLE